MPAYNAAKYIERALDSILEQSYRNFEIILINDGSKDETAKICVDYANKDSRILFVDKQNEGVAVTRNIALNIVRGDYIMFVDADDVITPDSLQKIANKLQDTQVDLLRFEYKTIDENEQELYPNHEARRRQKYENIVMDAPCFMKKVMRLEYQLCFNVFRRNLLKNYSITFFEGCTYCEDTLFIINYLKVSKTHIYIQNVVYEYRKFSGAVTSCFNEKKVSDVFSVFLSIMRNLPSNTPLGKEIKVKGEDLGRFLFEINKEFGIPGIDEQVLHYCSKKPISIEWKLFNVFGYSSWKYIKLLRKIFNRIRVK